MGLFTLPLNTPFERKTYKKFVLKFKRHYLAAGLVFGFCWVHLNTPKWIVLFSQLNSEDGNVYITIFVLFLELGSIVVSFFVKYI